MSRTTTKRAALYLRTSTNGQTTDNQRRELEAVGERRGWNIVGVYEDAGISGGRGRDKRPDLDRLLKDASRGRFDLVAAWSVDRLGRSLQDLVGFLMELHALDVDLYLHTQALDTTTPSGRAMFGMLSVFAEFEREIIRERIKAGQARAKERGTRSGRPIGRPRINGRVERAVRAMLAEGQSGRAVARSLGISEASVRRIAAREGAGNQ
jgi:DNA invertase Pin-like site-specific DNA recombinase